MVEPLPPAHSAYYIGGGGDLQEPVVLGLEAAVQSLNTIVQLHFEKTLEKKRAVDAQKQELWRLFLLFFLFLAVLLSGMGQTGRIQCRHVWVPLGLLSFAHLAFYAAVAHHLRCINGFRYQRRCHKLTLTLATERLKMVRSRYLNCGGGEGAVMSAAEVEVPYQEPPESYLGKVQAQLGDAFWVSTMYLWIHGGIISSHYVLLKVHSLAGNRLRVLQKGLLLDCCRDCFEVGCNLFFFILFFIWSRKLIRIFFFLMKSLLGLSACNI